jgi:hypothetical protein
VFGHPKFVEQRISDLFPQSCNSNAILGATQSTRISGRKGGCPPRSQHP